MSLYVNIGFKTEVTGVTVKTTTFAARFLLKVKLTDVGKLYPQKSYYEPEILNGFSVKIPNTNGVLTMFHTGRFYATGIDKKIIVTRFIKALTIELQVFAKNVE